MKKNILLILITISFILLKLTDLGVRLSDTNIYFNLTSQIYQGKLIYRDLFFSNFPFFTYVSSFYYLITFRNIILFYFTAVIETLLTGLLIYHIIYIKTKDYMVSILSLLTYLFSFIVLSTSDHQTGVSTASLLMVLAFYFFQKRKMLISGIFVALSVLTKAYFLPIAVSFLIYLVIKKEWRKTKSLIIGVIITSFIVLIPFLILAPKQFIGDVFGFSLTRPAGSMKTDIAWFFIAKDFLLFILLLFNLINFRKNLLFSLISLFSIIFLLGYQDVYYLYINFLIPFLCLSLYEFYGFIKKTFHPQKFVFPTIICLFLLFNLFIYITGYQNFEKINNFNLILSVINREKPNYLYGVNDITPALLAITKIPALDNIIDSHVYFFERGMYDRESITKQVISTRTILITHGATYPQLNIQQNILDNDIIDSKIIYEKCKEILSLPVTAEGATNRINLFKCYK